MRYLIVGNGVAGTKAAEAIRRRDASGEIVILSDEQVPFYRRPALVDHLAGRVSLEGLEGRPKDFYQQMGIDLRLNRAAVGLNAQTHELSLDDGETLPYDRLLLAVGLRRSLERCPGADLKGIVTLHALKDLTPLRNLPPRARNAVVVGEGVLGLETARALVEQGLSVVYLLEGAHFWPEVLSPDASTLVEQRLESEGVEVRPGQLVEAFLGQRGRVQAVRTTSGEEFPCAVAGVGMAMAAPVDWAKEAGLAAEDRIRLDDNLRTNLPDIFAAGDAVRLDDEVISFGWLRAWHQGVVAAVNMTGRTVPYRRRTVSLSTQAFGLPLLVMGDPNPERRQVRRKHGDYPLHGVYKELTLDEEGRVIGAIMVGEVSEASRVEALVREQLPYDEVDANLLRRLFDQRYWGRPAAEVLCPVCKYLMQIGEEERQMEQVTCPICGAEFSLRPTGDRFVVVME